MGLEENKNKNKRIKEIQDLNEIDKYLIDGGNVCDWDEDDNWNDNEIMKYFGINNDEY